MVPKHPCQAEMELDTREEVKAKIPEFDVLGKKGSHDV